MQCAGSVTKQRGTTLHPGAGLVFLDTVGRFTQQKYKGFTPQRSQKRFFHE
jgi:hypothetical protein